MPRLRSRRTPRHSTVSDTTYVEKEESDTYVEKEEYFEKEELTDILSRLDLTETSVNFVMEQGEEFLDYPDELAERLSVDVSIAIKALDELMAFKISQISKEEIEKFELLLKQNPQKNLKQIALSHGINKDVVSA